MHIVTRRHLAQAVARYQDAATEVHSWYDIARVARWRNILEVRQHFPDADLVGEFVVFNIRHNRYRLIAIIHYARMRNGRLTEGHVYIRASLTHKEYENKLNWNRGGYR